MIVKKRNGWYQTGNHFAKWLEGSTYTVIQVGKAKGKPYVQWYDGVNIANATPDFFRQNGSYEEYIQQQSDIEKAVYLTVYSLDYDSCVTCRGNKEVGEILIEENVLSEDDIFDFVS
ncbi:hypothetical protein [Domibacillus iocasae]|uniref:Uncharacterized protein n=1 Tax=Domibacillus iocasae TaxID=1714016 RepID=A0A1E7DNF8_9BACI|nr:hypothetical protein [Domibacillus iocasae]OES44630.1 hypothetical protein BA724_10230 [Domibacillus iocasae]